jgi:hypothetical protein
MNKKRAAWSGINLLKRPMTISKQLYCVLLRRAESENNNKKGHMVLLMWQDG